MKRRKAIYAGTFDPITLGHMDLVERGADIFDHLILAVAVDSPKNTVFTLDERLALCRSCARRLPNVEVTTFDGLLVDYACSRGVNVLLRGLRAYSDFEYEFQMALTNRKLSPRIETLFMMPKENHSYLSSSTVRQVAALGGDTSGFVPPAVRRALEKKFRRA
jgi:pantetheine-phosphate adenylyltransferase